MKEILVNFGETYFDVFQKSRLLTQIFAFPLAIVIFLNFFDLIYRLNAYEGEISPELRLSVMTDLTVLLTTAVLFASRFLLLFSKRKISFWISQLVWLAAILFIHHQIVPGVVCTKNALPTFGETIAFWLLGYMIVSPVRQIITLLFAIAIALQAKGKVSTTGK